MDCSLGAHGAGYVGNVMRQANATIGRITGLDPAGPYFTSLPAEVRLDPTDATFVDTVSKVPSSLLTTDWCSTSAHFVLIFIILTTVMLPSLNMALGRNGTSPHKVHLE